MTQGGNEVISKLQNSPETLSDEELTRISLSVFSKGLGVFTSRRVINAYLRWLEVQRNAPKRNINYSWFNTTAHWTQALRARGFSLEEISREVFAWKEVNGPFMEPFPSNSESRLPPTSANLAFGWDRTPISTKLVPDTESVLDSKLPAMSRVYSSQLERKLDSALTKVPTSYICNRCKGKGHYVSDCPTNEDPKYDIAAGFDYVCKFCKERGTHYFLFCPRNPDPNSIYRRRQGRAFQSLQVSPSCTDLTLKRTITSSPGSPESPSPATRSRTKIVVPEFSNLTAEFDLFSERMRTRSRNAMTEGFDNGFADIGRGMSDVTMGNARNKESGEDDDLRNGRFVTLGPSEGDMVWERLKNDIQREHSRGLRKQSNALTKQTVPERPVTESITPTATNKSPHADFLIKLFAKHPSHPNLNCRPRMTAIEMWDINDEKKCDEEDEEMARVSERELSTEPNTPDENQMRNLNHRSDERREDSVDVNEGYYLEASEKDREQVDLLVDKEFQGHKKHEEEQEESPNREEKMRAIQKKITSIESLRTKLVSGEDVDSPEMEQMASGDLSQEELDDISRRMRAPEPNSPSGLTSSSSELSSPPRLLSSGSRSGKGVFR